MVRTLRKALTGLAVVVAIAVVAPPAAAIPAVEAEWGTAVNPFCSSDGEVAGPIGMSGASGAAGFFFPETGCQATYTNVAVVTGVSFRMTGIPGERYCGQFLFPGGSSVPACADHGQEVFASAVGVLPGVVTWVVTVGPPWVNGIADIYP